MILLEELDCGIIRRLYGCCDGATYSHSGLRTNSRSSIRLWGIVRRSLSMTLLSYIKMSRSIVRGPLSMVLRLPSRVSIALRLSNSSKCPSDVSICGLKCHQEQEGFIIMSHLPHKHH